ncbi:hypothetical protein [Sphingosinicella terrae]|uniref:hypothetical protein n=1 Tax=Sphingosinicella terrae TaxID=2172047 RepID=UPI0013B41CC5|nr:hypothetical protein [Sphingosinicella terrae]
MNRFLGLGTIAALAASCALAAPAQARDHGRSVSAYGPHGHGFSRSRSVSRQPGSVAVSRSLQTADGRGHSSSRSAGWGDGRFSGSASHRLNDGRSFGRSRTITAHDDGSYGYAFSRSGPNGGQRSRSGTYRPRR